MEIISEVWLTMLILDVKLVWKSVLLFEGWHSSHIGMLEKHVKSGGSDTTGPVAVSIGSLNARRVDKLLFAIRDDGGGGCGGGGGGGSSDGGGGGGGGGSSNSNIQY
ncbi:hypothetical protein JTB14_038156 [Gonioctena quinquepunctata]|nr:hypothetical protein JTB14_038156 [Gonioctena quinquepunctata]